MLTSVFSTPVDDTAGLYANYFQLIESHAQALGVELERLTQEPTMSPKRGKAAIAKSIRTRNLNQQLVRKAQTLAHATARGSDGVSTANKLRLGGFSIKSPPPFEEFIGEEQMVSPSSSSSSSITLPTPSTQVMDESWTPFLAFR